MRTAAVRIFEVTTAVALALSPVLRAEHAIDRSEYAQLVSRYRQQDVSALRQALTLTDTDLLPALDSAKSYGADTLRAAAMLHTDACIELLARNDASSALRHLSVAQRLVDEASLRDAASAYFARTWYAVTEGMLTGVGAAAWAESVRERARSVVPVSEAEGRFSEGLKFETSACEKHDALLFQAFGMKTSAPLRSAIVEFEAALQRNPRLYAAALHLGRARLLQGHLDEARRNLDLATRSPAARERYLAHLFIGAIAERTRAPGEAEVHYRRAISEFRWGQSAPLALATLLSRTGREIDSRQTIEELLSRPVPPLDPLWAYLSQPAREPMMILNVLRAEQWE